MAVTEQSATAASFGADDGLLKLVTETSILSGDLSCSIRLRKCHGSPRHRSPGRDDLFLQLSNLPFAERIFIISLFIEYRLGWDDQDRWRSKGPGSCEGTGKVVGTSFT